MARILLSLLLVTCVPLPALWADTAVAGSQSSEESGLFARSPESTGESEIRALAQAYPRRISESSFRNGDWAVRIDDTWYYWARGRLLPAALRDQWEQYTPYRFYRYPLELPPVRRLDPEDRERLKERLESADRDPPRRHEAFLAALFRASTRGETESRIRSVRFLGLHVSVHEEVVQPLAAVERTVAGLMVSSRGVREFVEGLRGFAGYNWRPIAGTRSRSYHSYGIAIDLVPRSYGGLHVYWRWALSDEPEWYSLPYNRRWMVPEPIVRAFEDQGFIWGGKWLFFDTIHFEYRPELLILALPGAREGAREGAAER